LQVEFEPPFEIISPAVQSMAIVVNVPHAGRVYPESFVAAARLDRLALRRSEDCFVDQLFADAVALGAPLMTAHFPRAFLDVNREPYELDPRMFEGRLPAFANTRSMRVAGGLGSIPRIVGDGQSIYRGRLPVAEGIRRIETIHRPYHRALRGLVERTRLRFGEAVLLDCHSMPSASLGADPAARPDIVLGDRFGTSCAPRLTDIAQAAFEAHGYQVARNRPYAGGFITEHYGQPGSGVHALQIEVNRALYMAEAKLEPHHGFGRLKGDLRGVLAAIGQSFAGEAAWPLAAE
jgi:N-formylglutamate amidohydrolase